MIRYRQLTEAELAERDQKVAPSDRVSRLQKQPSRVKQKTVKLSAVKRQHHARQTEPPPRKIAKRHAAPPTRKP